MNFWWEVLSAIIALTLGMTLIVLFPCFYGWHRPTLVWGWITVGPYPELELDIVCMRCHRLLQRSRLTRADHEHALGRYNARSRVGS